MKKLNLKLFFLFSIIVLSKFSLKAQVICDPLYYPQCGNCMVIDIFNDLPCSMDFHWEYSYNGCGRYTYAGSVGAFGTTKLTGKCASFCDQTCQCPSWLRIQEWGGNPGFLNWGYNGVFGTGSFVDCAGNVVNYTITQVSSSYAIIRFY